MRYNSKMVKLWTNEIRDVIINGSKHYSGVLTKKQVDILTEWIVSNITQEEAGKKLGLCQTSIHKTLFGNIDYERDKRYGGIFNKIRKWESGSYTGGQSGYIQKTKK